MKYTIPGEFIEMKGRIIDGMSNMLEGKDEDESGAGFSGADIDKCDAILMTYLASVFEPGVHADADKIMAAVETVVLALNALNDDCDQALIETDQREGLYEIIVSAAAQAGLVVEGYDITEEWRDW